MKKILPILYTLYCILYTFAPKAAAETLVSPNYTIRLGNFNMTSGFKSSASYNLTDTVGQIAAEFFSSAGYHVKAGFQYIYTLYNFSFSISTLAVNLGYITPNTFSNATHTLTVTTPGQGYSVTAYETSKFKNTSGVTIGNTTCDSGTCSETAAGAWIIPTNNGFGFNLVGNDIAPDFSGPTLFRPFRDISAGGNPEMIMTSTTAGKNRVATVTYQVSPSGTQASGNYSTQVIYIATPVY